MLCLAAAYVTFKVEVLKLWQTSLRPELLAGVGGHAVPVAFWKLVDLIP